MDEQRQEQASAYALGVLPESERTEFESALARDPELQALVREFRDALGDAAKGLPAVTPRPELKARILRQIATTKPAPELAPPTGAAVEPGTRGKLVVFPAWMPWAAAAGLAIAAVWGAGERRSLELRLAARETIQRSLERVIAELEQEGTARREREAELVAEATDLRQQIGALERSALALQNDLEDALKSTDLANMRLARLGSLIAEQPRALGVSLWNDSTKQGVLVVENLPLPPAGKTYEVWVVDPGRNAPVSAGIFTTDAEGRGRMVFRPKSSVQGAAQIAVSLENAGGSTKGVPDVVIMGGAATQL